MKKLGIIGKIKRFYYIWIKKYCPNCKVALMACLVYATFEPYISCGECGLIFDKNKRFEYIDGD